MKITSRFTVAVQTLLVIRYFGQDRKVTSDFIAASVNVNPVVIRRILGALKKAALVRVKAGSGGAYIARDAAQITLYDVYCAVDCVEDQLFHFHERPNPACPVGKNMHGVLDRHLTAAQTAMEDELKKVTLADLTDELDGLTAN